MVVVDGIVGVVCEAVEVAVVGVVCVAVILTAITGESDRKTRNLS